MLVYKGYKKFKGLNPVVTIGVFDGVHQGHISLLEIVVKRAKETGGESVAITFDPHPQNVLGGDQNSLRFLTSLEERRNLLEKVGLNHLIVIPFNKSLSQLSTSEFVKEILVDSIKISHLVIGFNHRFGHKSPEVNDTILECANQYGFTVETMEAVIIDSLAVSSTNIREHLREGRLDNANKLLGYDYFLRGSVIEGMKIGRIMGYPTANLQPADSGKLIPKNGVYAVKVDIKGELHKAMLYIGTRPTHKEGGGVRTIEANIFDFEDDIYGSTLIIHFLHRLRDDIKYENTDLLSEQIRKDKEDTLRLLS